jgi:hypothetical protein
MKPCDRVVRIVEVSGSNLSTDRMSSKILGSQGSEVDDIKNIGYTAFPTNLINNIIEKLKLYSLKRQ